MSKTEWAIELVLFAAFMAFAVHYPLTAIAAILWMINNGIVRVRQQLGRK